MATPTGIAFLTNLVNSYQLPYKYSIESYGVGIGSLKLPYPNLVRVLQINSNNKYSLNQHISPSYEQIAVQEAWIDDQTPEEIANFVEILRNEGAYDVSYQTINMKKNRVGFSIQVILPVYKQENFRKLWFQYSSTIGLRERIQSRWIILRRRGECSTSLGEIKFKQILKPDGSLTLKPENDEVLRLQIKHNKKAEEIRNIIMDSIGEFKAFEDWK